MVRGYGESDPPQWAAISALLGVMQSRYDMKPSTGAHSAPLAAVSALPPACPIGQVVMMSDDGWELRYSILSCIALQSRCVCVNVLMSKHAPASIMGNATGHSSKCGCDLHGMTADAGGHVAVQLCTTRCWTSACGRKMTSGATK